jgi:hypothetical protein
MQARAVDFGVQWAGSSPRPSFAVMRLTSLLQAERVMIRQDDGLVCR